MYRSEAFVYHAPGDVRRETRTLECGPQDMIARVILCARCGTDQTIFRKGHPQVDRHAPIVLGHEMVGRIEEIGAQVKSLQDGLGYKQGEALSADYLDFKPGERVVVQSRAARYANGLMLMERPVEILSFWIDGAYSQYVKLTPRLIATGSVVRVPANVSDEAAALAEPTACALESIYATPHPTGADSDGRHQYRGGILRGGRCCVIGSGVVSMIYARLARLDGAAQIVMLIRSPRKADLVKRILGNEVSVEVVEPYSERALPDKLAIEETIVARMREITEGHLFDDVIAACPDPNSQRLMLKLYSQEGYAVGACFGGTHERVEEADIDLHHYRIAKTVGTSGCSTRTLESVVRRLVEGRLKLDGLLDPDYFSLDDDPAEFFTTRSSGLRPALDPWKARNRT